jgi:hypothetical protein
VARAAGLKTNGREPRRDSQPCRQAQACRCADLEREYLAALSRTAFADLQPLIDAGVGGAGLAIGPALAPISVSRDGFFQFDPDGEGLAFILPVRVESALTPEAADPIDAVRHGAIVDLVAFSLAFPYRWALRCGTATWAGAVEPQYLDPAPTPIWRSPLHWLGNGSGLVLLSRDKRDRYRVLSNLDSIIAEDEAHAERLRKLLAQPWLAPPVYVCRGREVRHAA